MMRRDDVVAGYRRLYEALLPLQHMFVEWLDEEQSVRLRRAIAQAEHDGLIIPSAMLYSSGPGARRIRLDGLRKAIRRAEQETEIGAK